MEEDLLDLILSVCNSVIVSIITDDAMLGIYLYNCNINMMIRFLNLCKTSINIYSNSQIHLCN